MKISCDMAEDLLPLYLEDSCSEDSRQALEQHLDQCPQCRARLERMRRDLGGAQSPPAADLAGYAKRIKRRRLRLALWAALGALLAAALLALFCLTLLDMRRQANPALFQVESGTYNLTDCEWVEAEAEELDQYRFYTNSEQIQAVVRGQPGFQGRVLLWDAEDETSFIQAAQVDEGENTCLFTNLSAANRYRISCENLEGAKISVSEGRTVSFWSSLNRVLGELVG